MYKRIIILCMLPVLWFMACRKSSVTEPIGPEVLTITIGFTASEIGNYSLLSERQVNGLKLWMNRVNAAGGIEMSDGSRIIFNYVSYNDESDKDNVQGLYTTLCTEDNVDFLISPYSSSLTAEAAVVADRHNKVLITTGAASDASHTMGYRTVFQTYTPASQYLTGAVDLLTHLDANPKKIAYVYENLEFSTIVVESARAHAQELGHETVLTATYEPGTTDFTTYINDIVGNEAEAVLGGGHFQDGRDFAEQLHNSAAGIDFLALLVAPPEPEFADIGDAAFGVIGPSQWESSMTFTPESAKEAGLEWFGPMSTVFMQNYVVAYNEEPSYHSMGGYAAGLVLEKAIIDADTTSTAAVVEALNDMDILTCYGRIKFDSDLEAHGIQIGHDMVYIQWQREDDALVKEVVWPLEGATAEAVYPLQ